MMFGFGIKAADRSKLYISTGDVSSTEGDVHVCGQTATALASIGRGVGPAVNARWYRPLPLVLNIGIGVFGMPLPKPDVISIENAIASADAT